MADNKRRVSAALAAENDATDWLIVETGESDRHGRFAFRISGTVTGGTVEIEVKRHGEADGAAVSIASFDGSTEPPVFQNGEFHISMLVRARADDATFAGTNVVADLWRP